jgi:hypothetical protein
MHFPTKNQLSSASPALLREIWATTRRLPAKQVSLTLFEGVQAGYHTKKATKASKTVSARSPAYHGCEQH